MAPLQGSPLQHLTAVTSWRQGLTAAQPSSSSSEVSRRLAFSTCITAHFFLKSCSLFSSSPETKQPLLPSTLSHSQSTFHAGLLSIIVWSSFVFLLCIFSMPLEYAPGVSYLTLISMDVFSYWEVCSGWLVQLCLHAVICSFVFLLLLYCGVSGDFILSLNYSAEILLPLLIYSSPCCAFPLWF